MKDKEYVLQINKNGKTFFIKSVTKFVYYNLQLMKESKKSARYADMSYNITMYKHHILSTLSNKYKLGEKLTKFNAEYHLEILINQLKIKDVSVIDINILQRADKIKEIFV